MVPAVMLNAASYIISRYQTEHLILCEIRVRRLITADSVIKAFSTPASTKLDGMRLSESYAHPPPLNKGILSILIFAVKKKRSFLL